MKQKKRPIIFKQDGLVVAEDGKLGFIVFDETRTAPNRADGKKQVYGMRFFNKQDAEKGFASVKGTNLVVTL